MPVQPERGTSDIQVAAIYDIHANLPALEAVLQDIRQAEVDRVVVGGDVLPGPMPLETIACLLDLDIPVQFIQGNGDREVLAQMRGVETGAVPEQFREVIRWVAQQLHPDPLNVAEIGTVVASTSARAARSHHGSQLVCQRWRATRGTDN